jgi:hypothetical protein
MARGCERHHAFDIVRVGIPIAVAIALALPVTFSFAVPITE